MSTAFYIIIALCGVFVSSISQVILKKSSKIHYDNPLREYLNVRVIGAYSLFFGATLLAIYAYKGLPLSFGPVLDSTGYFFVTFFGITVFKEKMNVKKVISLLLIITGIFVFSFS